MASRHLSRSIAMQSLYEWDFRGKKKDSLKEILERDTKEFAAGLDDTTFIYQLTDGVMKHLSEIDKIIEKAAPQWPLDQIAIVDRNVLRVGLFELLFGNREEVPPKVAINEAIELAKSFGGESSGKFVNGVLGTVYREIGEPGKDDEPNPSRQGSPRGEAGGAEAEKKEEDDKEAISDLPEETKSQEQKE